MQHIERISAYIQTLIGSDTFHALVVESAPGWGKSTTVTTALRKLGRPVVDIGSFATPLHFYNAVCAHPKSVILLDDSAGLFSDAKMMALLKAATWDVTPEKSKSSLAAKKAVLRRLTWGSTSDRVVAPEVSFSGKLILLTNAIPAGKETEAFLSRCLSYRITLGEGEIIELLTEAAKSRVHFPDLSVSKKVVSFFVTEKNEIDLLRVNLRSLKMGYDLAMTHSVNWRELFLNLLPKKQKVSRSGDWMAPSSSSRPIKEQEKEFLKVTGKSRRTFYNYRKADGLTRPYQSRRT